MLSCQDIILKFRADVEISCSLCLNTDEDSRILVMLKLLPDFSIQMSNIIFGYFDSDRTKENICFIINVIIFLS